MPLLRIHRRARCGCAARRDRCRASRPARPSPTRGQHARRLARRAHRIGDRQVERAPGGGRSAGWARHRGRACEVRCGSANSSAARACASDLMRDGGELCRRVSAPSRTRWIDGRAMGRDVEHLLARQGDLHRPLSCARGERRQDRVGVDRQLAAEAAADVRGDHSSTLSRRDASSVSAIDWCALSTICSERVDVQLVALPPRRGWRAAPSGCGSGRRGVGRVELHRRRRRTPASKSPTLDRPCRSAGLCRRSAQLAADSKSHGAGFSVSYVTFTRRAAARAPSRRCRRRPGPPARRSSGRCRFGELRLGPGVAVVGLVPDGACAGAFRCVMTSSTPGDASAAAVSTPVIAAAGDVAPTMTPIGRLRRRARHRHRRAVPVTFAGRRCGRRPGRSTVSGMVRPPSCAAASLSARRDGARGQRRS